MTVHFEIETDDSFVEIEDDTKLTDPEVEALAMLRWLKMYLADFPDLRAQLDEVQIRQLAGEFSRRVREEAHD